MAETKVVNLEVKTNVEPLKKQLKEAQREVEALAAKFGDTSAEAVNAAQKAALLKDAIGDAKSLTDSFNPDAKFNALSGSLSGVAGGFSAVQGAMGLVGVDSKNVEATLLKVQSAMAFSEGLNSVLAAKDAFKNLGAVIGKTAIGQKLLTAAQVVGATVMKALNFVMKQNPIFLIIAGITAAVAAFKYFTQATDSAALAQEELNRKQEISIRLMKIQQEDADKYISRLEKNSRDKIALARAEGANSEEIYQLEKTRLEDQIRYRKVLHDYGTKLTAEQYAQQKQAKFDLKILEAQHKTDLAKIEEEKTNKAKIENEKRVSDKKEENEKKLLADIEFRQNELINEKYWNDELQRLTDIENEKKAVKVQQEKDDIEMLSSFQIEIWEYEAAKQKEIDEKALADKKIIQNQQLQAVQDTFTIIANLSELFAGKSRKQQETAFKIQKAANIANATIDTYKAVMSTYASTPGGPVIKGIAGGVVLTAGLLNVKKIASTQFSSGSGSSGGGGGSTPSGGGGGNNAQIQAPSFNIVGNNGLNQLSQLKQAPIQAYVVSGAMSTAQSLDRNRVRNATL